MKVRFCRLNSNYLCRFFGLRSASAYLLVYDASSPSTFQHVRMLRDQMYESRDMTNVPVIVAANKSDKAAATANAGHHHHSGGHHQHGGGGGHHGKGGGGTANSKTPSRHAFIKKYRF